MALAFARGDPDICTVHSNNILNIHRIGEVRSRKEN